MRARIYGKIDESTLMVEIKSDTIKFENQNDVQALLEKLFSAKFRFNSNGRINADGTFLSGMTVLKYYKIHNPEILTQDIVVVPHAFYGSYRNRNLIGTRFAPYDDDLPLESEEDETPISIWIREHPKPEKGGRIKKLHRCPVCGDVLTEEEYLEGLDSGGIGYCDCLFLFGDEYGDFSRKYTEYEVFTLEES